MFAGVKIGEGGYEHRGCMGGHMPAIGHQRHGTIDVSGDDLDHHHRGGNGDDDPCTPLIAPVIVAQENVVVPGGQAMGVMVRMTMVVHYAGLPIKIGVYYFRHSYKPARKQAGLPEARRPAGSASARSPERKMCKRRKASPRRYGLRLFGVAPVPIAGIFSHLRSAKMLPQSWGKTNGAPLSGNRKQRFQF